MRWPYWMLPTSPRQAVAPSRSSAAGALTLGCCAAYKPPRRRTRSTFPSRRRQTLLPLRFAPLLLALRRRPFSTTLHRAKPLEDLRHGALEELRAALKLGARRADASPPAQGVARAEPSPSCNLRTGARGRRKPTPWEELKTPCRTWSTAGQRGDEVTHATVDNVAAEEPEPRSTVYTDATPTLLQR
jgi:hypothetical protein